MASSGGDKELSFEPVTITFIDLLYFVPNLHKRRDEPSELQLLQGITGTFRPGTRSCCLLRTCSL